MPRKRLEACIEDKALIEIGLNVDDIIYNLKKKHLQINYHNVKWPFYQVKNAILVYIYHTIHSPSNTTNHAILTRLESTMRLRLLVGTENLNITSAIKTVN